jgi:hypothetical protein
MSSSRIVYRPREDATPEGELSALSSVYVYLLKNHDSKKVDKPAPEPVGRDDMKDLNGYVAIRHQNK